MFRVAETFTHRAPVALMSNEKPLAVTGRDSATLYVAGILLSCIYLQRFGIVSNRSALAFVQVLAMAIWTILLLANRAVLDRGMTMLFATFTVLGCVATLVAYVWPVPFADNSILAFFLILSLYAPWCLQPRYPVDGDRILRLFNNHMIFLAVLGILQYFVQFLGVSLFSFKPFVPSQILIESAYNTQIPLSYGSQTFKSNGFFFLEPSFFSQYLALGILIELLFLRRYWPIAIYAGALLVSFSGSGLLVLIITTLAVGLGDSRYRKAIIFTIVVAVALGVLTTTLFPGYSQGLMNRLGEFETRGTSGYFRYVTPFMVLDELKEQPRFALGFGAGAADRLSLRFGYAMNALAKILVDYGIVGFCVFFIFVVRGLFKRSLSFLSVGCLAVYFGGGGYQTTPSIIYTMAALCVWSSRPSAMQPFASIGETPSHAIGSGLVKR